MLLFVAAEYNSSPLVKLLEINEETGSLKIKYLDSSDGSALKEVKELLDEGTSFADFQIIETKVAGGLDAYELRHLCSNVAPGEPDLSLDGMVVEDKPSYLGFVRKLIGSEGGVVLPSRHELTEELPQWRVANLNTIQFTNEMGMRISHLVPGKEEDHWRWTSSTILMNNFEDKFSDVTDIIFLAHTEFDAGEYLPYIEEQPPIKVLNESGYSVTYRAFKVKPELPIYTYTTNAMVTPAVISRLKFVADSYKLALYSLTEGLFEDKKIEYGDSSDRYSAPLTGRFLKFNNKIPVSKKTAIAMQTFLFDSLSGKTTTEQEDQFLKEYPHYQVYASIIKSQIHTFFGGDSSKKQKMHAYKALKNVEAYFNLLLQECRYTVMFEGESYLFNLWTSTLMFNSDIPHYKVTLQGGGGKWRPNVSLF